MKNDKFELNNIAADEKYFDVISDMRKKLVEWMDEIKDPILNMWTRAQLEENLKV